jgi:methyl-accepting chemotaxis protein
MTAVTITHGSKDAEVPSEQWTRRDPKSLTTLLSTREPIVDLLARLQSLVPRLDELHLEATMLSRKVSSTAQTAQRVGGRVRSLDEEMHRIRDAGERVSQVMELKVIVTV